MKKNRERIFIFGSAGEVGSDLVKFFSNKYEVYAFQRCKKKKDIKNKNVKFIYHNFVNSLKIKIKPKIIINCIVSHEFSKKNNFSNIMLNNSLSALHISEFAKKKKIKIINLSSVVIYNNFNKKNLYENSFFPETNLLGSLKLLVENSIKFQNKEYINLRLPGILTQTKNSKRPWLRKVIFDIKQNRNLLVYNKDSFFNNLTTSKEIFRFIDFLINKKVFHSGTYNFSSNRPIKIYQLLDTIKKYYKSSSIIKYSKTNKNSFIIINNKLEKTFNFKIYKTKDLLLDYLNDI